MSADNWEVCPRCIAKAREDAEAEREAVMATYGSVPVEEFDARRAALRDVDPDDFRTFREDYEFWGASEGEVHVEYKGACSKCGLGVTLEAAKEFWFGDTASDEKP